MYGQQNTKLYIGVSLYSYDVQRIRRGRPINNAPSHAVETNIA